MSNSTFKYSSTFDFAFSIDHDCEDPCDIPREKLIEAAKKRLDSILLNENYINDFGDCDTYENF